jgi:hypothetical protein
MLTFDPTTPAGRPLLSVDFSRLLPSGITIASATVTIDVRDTSPAGDASASSRLDGAAFVDPTGTIVSQWFRNGVADVDYVLSFLATFTDGQIEPVQVEMPVRRYA